MKRKYKKNRFLVPFASILIFSAIAVWMVNGVRQASSSSSKEGLVVAEQAIRQAAVSCYALDGAYPDSYDDLKRRSGVSVEEDKYVVFYEVFASNIMPEITVIEREEDVP